MSKAGGQPGQSRAVIGLRALEMVGLVTLIYGLASDGWLIALAGAGLVVVSYVLYRGPKRRRGDNESGGMAIDVDAGDGGGD